jgi:hypothetical protein
MVSDNTELLKMYNIQKEDNYDHLWQLVEV